jgi:acyl-CoA synthetase (AMP-forming)/AMP-acid ligase II
METMELTAIVHAGAARHGDAIAVSCDDGSQTYTQLHQRACQLANALAALGIRRGERVATLSGNCLEIVEQMTGIALGGYVRTSLYAHSSAESNLYLLNLVEASVLIVDAAQYPAIAPHLPHAEALRHVLVFGAPAPAGTLSYEEALAAAGADDPGTLLGDDDPHVIRFSSGTTGKPKGILHSVARWCAVAREMALLMPPLDAKDRYLAAGPLAHAALLPLFGTLAAGGRIVVMPAFDPAQFVELVERERATITLLVPTMIQMITALPQSQNADLTSLRAVFYGAAPISERTLADGRAIWGDVMYQMYGQSEAVPLTVLTPQDHKGHRLRSAGRPTPNTVIRIVDADGNDVPAGQVGEIAAVTPAAMAAIWRDEAATAQRFLADGAVLTRDMGYLDDDGFLYLADRKEDMIISGGYNIWPAELENALASHPAVAEVAVVGVPHDKWGETPKAVVVLRTGCHGDEQELIDWSRDKVGAIKRVTSVEFTDVLPKSPVGKVLRREVKKRFWDSTAPAIAGA